jgi:hypothetical protein
MGRNVEVLKGMIPTLVKLSPDTIFLVVTNPCDALSYITYKLSGLPPHRVLGSGTYLDSSRFRTLLASRFDVNPQSVHGWILGEVSKNFLCTQSLLMSYLLCSVSHWWMFFFFFFFFFVSLRLLTVVMFFFFVVLRRIV